MGRQGNIHHQTGSNDRASAGCRISVLQRARKFQRPLFEVRRSLLLPPLQQSAGHVRSHRFVLRTTSSRQTQVVRVVPSGGFLHRADCGGHTGLALSNLGLLCYPLLSGWPDGFCFCLLHPLDRDFCHDHVHDGLFPRDWRSVFDV